MDREEVLREFRAADALLEGHFILTSGLRSPIYLQCAKLLMYPDRAGRVCAALAECVRKTFGANAFDYVVSPAMGGVVIGYEMGRQLGVPAMFTERVDGTFAFRRGFRLDKGARVLMVEDVVTTGKSSRECIACIREEGGVVVGAACLVDRSDGEADLGVPLVPLVSMKVPVFDPDALPPELSGIPAVKPGSRGLN
jgi:orotate phosphoribosyltransferase